MTRLQFNRVSLGGSDDDLFLMMVHAFDGHETREVLDALINTCAWVACMAVVKPENLDAHLDKFADAVSETVHANYEAFQRERSQMQ